MKFQFINIHLPKLTLLYIAGILFLLSFLISFYLQINPSVRHEENKLESYIHSQQRDFEIFIRDSATMRKLVIRSESLKTFEKISEKDYGIFLFAETISNDHQLLFWNNQKSLPPQADYSLKDGEYFQKLSNGYYLTIKKTIRLSGMSNNLVCYAMIPILYKYDYEHSSYLNTHFAHDQSASNKISFTERKTGYPINSLSGKILFHVERKSYTPIKGEEPISAFMRILAFVLLLAYLHFFAEAISKKRGPLGATLFLLLSLVAIRALLYLFPGLFNFRQFALFDPKIYGTNWFNRSLGDLLINSIFFCWLVVFTWYNMGPIKRLPSFLHGKRVVIAGVIGIFILIISTFEFANIVRSIIADSKISFNVIDFFSLDAFTVIGFIILALISLSYYYFTRILYRFIFPAFSGNNLMIYFTLASVGLIYLTIRSGSAFVLFYLPILAWLLVYTLLLSQEQFIINRFRVTIAGILFWIFIFSVSLAAIILTQNRIKEIRERQGIAEKLDERSDPSSVRSLSIAITYLDNDFLRDNFYRFFDPNQNKYVRDSIINENISTGLVLNYDTRIFVFDSLDNPVNNLQAFTFSELNNLFLNQSKPTDVKDLSYYETSYDQLTYIGRRTITDGIVPLGTFFLVATPKRYSQDAISLELLQSSSSDPKNSSIYSYAIYSKKDSNSSHHLLIDASPKYSFKTYLVNQEVPKEETSRKENGDYDELWYKANKDKIIVVAKKKDTLIESITLFSYLFCAYLFMVALIQFIALLLKAGADWKSLNPFWQLNIRSQVHSTVIFISVLSFIIIGVATISFFITRYNNNNKDKLSRTAGIMVEELKQRADEYGTFDDVIKIYDPVVNANLQKLINEVSEIHDVDVNVYDLEGNLQVSSAIVVYAQGILSTKMHPEAYYHLHRMREVQYVHKETMSSLEYLSIYAAVRDNEGNVYAYLNVPYFLSEIDLNQEISNFLVTIINLNAFIFLIAGIIAFLITNRITRSFSIIGEKMNEIRLGKTNQEIVWTRNDEIGELVKQYNKMVHQLEESAQALAKSEREGAWREMARQVAHEIKNPLTPMKLSIQYLQKAIHNNQPNVKELTSSVANTLVEQIDHLSKIAADFARFANIGNRYVERFDLHQVIDGLKELYRSNPKVEIKWSKTRKSLIMDADKTHMNRLFTNLLTNAIDACSEKEKCIIEISEEVQQSNVLIKVKDNGEGIPEEIRPSIFTPNFTTKSSGTGLGLAMSKSIVEQAGGSIWFETAPGVGSTFFVLLPLAS